MYLPGNRYRKITNLITIRTDEDYGEKEEN